MKLLTFQARKFSWKSFSKTLPDVPDQEVDESAEDAVVVFLQAEEKDTETQARQRAFRHTLKHIKWLANKREMKQVVLHSFTHLGGVNAPPAFAQTLMEELADRLRGTGFEVSLTPFGYFCSWDLDVYGESLAKVWKEI